MQNRTPIDQGFDDWYGIPNTSNEAQWVSAPELKPNPTDTSFIWAQHVGGAPTKVKVFDLDTRRTVDRESAHKSVEFIERNAKARKPFFLYYPMTQIHFPTLTHPDFMGKTGAGDIGDAMMDVDHNVGLVLNALKRMGLERNTLVMWCPTTAPKGVDRGADRRVRGAVSTTPSWRAVFARRA